jgi:hypothetical protein
MSGGAGDGRPPDAESGVAAASHFHRRVDDNGKTPAFFAAGIFPWLATFVWHEARMAA